MEGWRPSAFECAERLRQMKAEEPPHVVDSRGKAVLSPCKPFRPVPMVFSLRWFQTAMMACESFGLTDVLSAASARAQLPCLQLFALMSLVVGRAESDRRLGRHDSRWATSGP